MFDLSLAIGHHLSIFGLFGVLAAELVLVRPSLDTATIRRASAKLPTETVIVALFGIGIRRRTG